MKRRQFSFNIYFKPTVYCAQPVCRGIFVKIIKYKCFSEKIITEHFYNILFCLPGIHSISFIYFYLFHREKRYVLSLTLIIFKILPVPDYVGM